MKVERIVPLFPEIFRSVELIWMVWIISIFACVGLTYALRRGQRRSWRGLREEDGAAYAVPYVMTFPLYALFIALVIECSLLLVAKIGSMYAAYAAVRSAVVWESAKAVNGKVSNRLMQDKSERAAVLAMAGFASGSTQHAAGGSTGSNLVAPVVASAELFRKGRFVNSSYLARKVRYSAGHTRVTNIDRASNAPDALLTATVEFDAPFHIPGIGRLIGQASGNGYYVIRVNTSATLPSESPQNEARDIGIQYISE